jgi:hypothetical protein
LFIPLLKDTNVKRNVNALFIAQQQNDSVGYRVIENGAYKHLNNNSLANAATKEDVVLLCMNLEKNVFNHNSFKIVD